MTPTEGESPEQRRARRVLGQIAAHLDAQEKAMQDADRTELQRQQAEVLARIHTAEAQRRAHPEQFAPLYPPAEEPLPSEELPEAEAEELPSALHGKRESWIGWAEEEPPPSEEPPLFPQGPWPPSAVIEAAQQKQAAETWLRQTAIPARPPQMPRRQAEDIAQALLDYPELFTKALRPLVQRLIEEAKEREGQG